LQRGHERHPGLDKAAGRSGKLARLSPLNERPNNGEATFEMIERLHHRFVAAYFAVGDPAKDGSKHAPEQNLGPITWQIGKHRQNARQRQACIGKNRREIRDEHEDDHGNRHQRHHQQNCRIDQKSTNLVSDLDPPSQHLSYQSESLGRLSSGFAAGQDRNVVGGKTSCLRPMDSDSCRPARISLRSPFATAIRLGDAPAPASTRNDASTGTPELTSDASSVVNGDNSFSPTRSERCQRKPNALGRTRDRRQIAIRARHRLQWREAGAIERLDGRIELIGNDRARGNDALLGISAILECRHAMLPSPNSVATP
jgi:hypothetical protein